MYFDRGGRRGDKEKLPAFRQKVKSRFLDSAISGILNAEHGGQVLRVTIGNMLFAVCCLLFAVCCLLFAVCRFAQEQMLKA
jgi:hypothetical protein